jgi:hypothetical protein
MKTTAYVTHKTGAYNQHTQQKPARESEPTHKQPIN